VARISYVDPATIEDPELLATLRRRIRPLMLRRTKDQVVADLPPKQEQVLDVVLNPKHQKIYQTHLQRERQKVLGLLDDRDNIRGRGVFGLPAYEKIAFQAFIGLLVGIGLDVVDATRQYIPGLGAPDLHGAGIIAVSILAVIAVSNAVNLTDGVDGLAASCSAVVFAGLLAVAVHQHALPVVIVSAALVGALAAFLVFNWFPARLFMGDTGSLALGCALVAAAAEVHLLWLLPLMGIVFVAETLSVIINVTAIRRFHHRILRASPLHHHFEELGLRERRLVVYFTAVAAMGTLLTVLYARSRGALA